MIVIEKDPTGRAQHEAGAKLDEGKQRAGLVLLGFHKALEEVIAVGTYGAEKYSPDGWKDVPNPAPRYTDAMLRHLLAEMREDCDPESELLHAAHAAWNALARLHFIAEARDLWRRP